MITLFNFFVYADEVIGPAERNLPFIIPRFDKILSFIIQTFFVAAGLAALLFLLLGAFKWITSGGNKENVDKAREQIQAAVVGLILIVVVLAIVVLFERVIFGECGIGLGLTCDLKIPTLLEPK